MAKPKIPTTEAHEIMQLYFKLTGQKITSQDKLLHVHAVLDEFIKRKTNSESARIFKSN